MVIILPIKIDFPVINSQEGPPKKMCPIDPAIIDEKPWNNMRQHQTCFATPGHHAQDEECAALPEFLLFLLEFRHADHLHSTCPHRQSENDLGVGLPKTNTSNSTYCYLVHRSGYTAPHTNCIYNLIYISMGLSEHGYTPNPRVKSSRSLLKLLSPFSDTSVVD